MREIESGAVDLVIVYKIDRLSRSLLDFARVMERMSKLGVGLVSVTQNFSTTDAMGRLTLNMLMSFAEYEREMIAERTRDKIAAARRRGKWTGGLLPLGYRLEEGKLVIEEDEAMIVREVFSLYLETRSLVHVVEQLRDRGRKTKASTGCDARRSSSSKGSLRSRIDVGPSAWPARWPSPMCSAS
jgi:site-specific DNA recombinase